MKQTARSFAAFGSITEIMYSLFLTFFGALFPTDMVPVGHVFINWLLICGIAGLISAGLGLASAFMRPDKLKIARIFVCIAAVLCITVAAVMITTLGYFDLILSLIFGIPALILTVAAVISFTPDNKSGTAI